MVISKHPYSIRLDEEVWNYLTNEIGKGSLTQGVLESYRFYREQHEGITSPEIVKFERQLASVEEDIAFLKKRKHLSDHDKKEIKELEQLLQQAREVRLPKMRINHIKSFLQIVNS